GRHGVKSSGWAGPVYGTPAGVGHRGACRPRPNLLQYPHADRPWRPDAMSRNDPPPIPTDRIAQRAYEKWLRRGQQHGSDTQDWAEAEAELRAEQEAAAPPPNKWQSPTGQRF